MKPTDSMVILGAEVLHDSIRAEGFYVDFDENLNGPEITQRIAEAVYMAMQEISTPPNTADIEQRVAEACAKYVSAWEYGDTKEVQLIKSNGMRSGKWREYL